MTMIPKLARRRDRAGHRLLLASVLLVTMVSPAAAASRQYVAQRFDAAIRVTPGGDLEVRETVTFDFQAGTFEKVWREIPGRRTDGIEILDATMDDVPVTQGRGPGHVVLSGRQRTRVEWQFTPVGPSTHTFGLKYRVRRVVFTDERGDVVAWRALPTEHGYRIASSLVTLDLPDAHATTPLVERRGVGAATIAVDDRSVVVRASEIARNGWIAIETVLPSRRIVAVQPEWRQREIAAASLGPRWAAGAAAMAMAGILIVVGVRRHYDRPLVVETESMAVAMPEQLPPALAGALLSRGRVQVGHALATLVDLANRGVLLVRELPKPFGTRQYELAQVPGRHELLPHEEAALTIAFAGDGDEVNLSKARGRLVRNARRFAAAAEADLLARGLIDPGRRAIRDRLLAIGIVFMMTGAIAVIPLAMLVDRFGPWPLLLPLGLVIAAFAGIIGSASTTALSNDGVVRAARWRGFRRYLKSALADRQVHEPGALAARDLPLALALGLGSQYSRYLTRHPGALPPWFAAADAHDGGMAWAAFIGTTSHGAGGAGAGAGGAAGGGGSGAG